MSRAFIREDVDPPERSGRKRSASGLPPGAMNYITRLGSARLQRELADLRQAGAADEERIAELERIIASATVVDPPRDSGSIAFGAVVTVRDAAGHEQIFHIVGVDELDFEPNAVSWISSIGKTLLAAQVGARVTLESVGPVKIVKVDYPAG
jgi:transcription elongation factor GreB